jgi:hypothetical protein
MSIIEHKTQGHALARILARHKASSFAVKLRRQAIRA